MKIRYVTLHPSRIYNWLGIENCTAWLNVHQWQNTWHTLETIELRNQFAKVWIEEFDKITGHFSSLRESISKNGIQDPISLVGGHPRDQFLNKISTELRHVPIQWQNNLKELLYTHPFGGSRLTIAAELNLPVTAIVYDFAKQFPNEPEITQYNCQQYCGKNYKFFNHLPNVRVIRQSHIKDSKFNSMNNSTREAQRSATKRTKEILCIT